MKRDVCDGQPTCAHCGGLHYGSPPGVCVFICTRCQCDIRPDAHPRCGCPPLEAPHPPRPYTPVPVTAAATIAREYRKSIVVIAAWDPEHGLLHMTTFGVSPQEKQWAATAGEIVSAALGCSPSEKICFEDFRRTVESPQ
jgi:hypothetical protein